MHSIKQKSLYGQEPQMASLYNFLKFIRFLKQDKCNIVLTKKFMKIMKFMKIFI